MNNSDGVSSVSLVSLGDKKFLLGILVVEILRLVELLRLGIFASPKDKNT